MTQSIYFSNPISPFMPRPKVIEEMLYPKDGGTYLVALESKAPAIIPRLEVAEQGGIAIRTEPQIETWGEDNLVEGFSKAEVVTNLVIKAQVKTDDAEKALTLGGDACYRMLVLLALMSNTALGSFHVKGTLDVTESRSERGMIFLGPLTTLPAVRRLTKPEIESAFAGFDEARWRINGRYFLDSASQYARGLNETSNPAEFLAYYVANEKLNPILKAQQLDKSKRQDWMTDEIRAIRHDFLHAMTKAEGTKKGSARVMRLGSNLASRVRQLLGDTMSHQLREEYREIDKNKPIQPLIVGCIHDPQGAYDGEWSMPALPSKVEFKGINKEGVFALDLKITNYDVLPGTTFEMVHKGFQTGGRFVRPVDIGSD